MSYPNNQGMPAGAIPVYIGGHPTPSVTNTPTSLNVSAATALKATPGWIIQVNVLVAGSAPGLVHDCATTGAAADANRVAVIPNAVGTYLIEWPCRTGIVVVPGSNQVLSVSYQ